MRVIYHNWSAMKQRPHPQSVAEISHHSVLSGGRIRQDFGLVNVGLRPKKLPKIVFFGINLPQRGIST